MFKRLSITYKLMLSYALLILCVLLLTAAFVLPMQTRERRADMETDLAGTAAILSKDPDIIEGLREGAFSQELIRRLDEIMEESTHSGYIVIADRNSIRLYHPDHDFIGEKFGGGDEARLFAGESAYISEGPGTSTPQLRAFHAVYDDSGHMLGFVIASDSLDAVLAIQRFMLRRFLLICLAVFGVGLLLAYVISANVRHILLGNDPPTFARMFLQREEILNHLSEGILAVDADSAVVYKNTAGDMICSDNQLSREHPLYEGFAACRDTGAAGDGTLVEIDGRSCIVSTVPVDREGLFHIVMLILRDRTEVVRLTEQVTGTNHMVDALRANTHEFINTMHVISGLLQVGDTETALDYIGDTSFEIESGYQTVVRQIQNRTIAALILGKMSHAKEMNILFTLRSDSALPAENPYLTTQEMVTIIGNLVENAFEAINGKPEPRQTELYVFCGGDGISISVDDSGRGMSEEQIRRIGQGRYSTKGDGHGYGLRLIREIALAHGGDLQIDSEPGVGSFISVIITNKTERPGGGAA